ncbi:MAG: HEAT repeat domain-containing protein [Chloroflexota bacterium]|nr:HEAT repeat domain-containing protein [Chloroflexota bacterium]
MSAGLPTTYPLQPATYVDCSQHIEDLAVAHRAKGALRRLMAAGPEATPALRNGLRHADPAVRVGCCIVLDHYLDEAALPELIANLDHENEDVRQWAMHALACDRCKEGACRPGEDDVVPIALRMLADDPSRRVRAQAVHLLGLSAAIRRQDVTVALERARESDPDPNVRKIARKYAPGGAIYERTVSGRAAAPTAGARRPYRRKPRRALA